MKPLHPRVLCIFILVLFVFLVLAAFLVAYQQRHLLRSSAYTRAEYDLDLMADASLEALLKSDYVTVRTFVARWGKSHKDIRSLQVLTPNGYVLAEYRNDASAAGEAYTLSREVRIASTAVATIRLAGDYRDAESIAAQLRIRLVLAALIITALFGAALWFTFKKLALAPLEEMVAARTRALSEANQELEQEIAERMHAEEALGEREKHITLVLDSVAEGIYGVDLRGNCSFCNPAALRMLGYERAEDVIGKNIHRLIHHTRPDGTPLHEADCAIYSSFREGKNAHADDELFWRSDGSGFPVEYWAQPIIRDGAPAGAVTAFVDITTRKRAEESLRESEEKFRTLFAESRDTFYISTPAGRFLDINPAGVELFGYDSREELLAIDIGRELYVDQEDRQRFIELVKRTGYTKNYEARMRRKNGAILNVAITSTAVRNSAGELISFRGIISDETERKKLEEQLRQSQRMESIGTLAGGVAHDFNNILTAISGYGHLTMMKMAAGDPNRMNIQYILESADRAAHLTKDLLMFSRKQPIDRKPVDLNEGIQKLGKFLTRVIGEDIAFKTTLSGGVIPVLADTYQIDQVLMNLATNARDAMPKGGTFTITTEQTWLSEQFTASHGLGTSGKYAVISASDTGQGMDEETRQRVFEPFFTTKEVGKGTGLGLSVVYGIVRQHEGQVLVYSEPGQGTTFKIYLPVNEAGASAGTAPVDEEQPVGGAETILLAEDDKLVREMTLLLLQDFGYRVITAVDGEDAVKKFSENKDRVQLLLFDLIMPGKSGKEAYDEIRQMRPGIKIIFSSGYDPDLVRQKALIAQNVPVVYKPVPMAVLLKLIRSVLDEGGGA